MWNLVVLVRLCRGNIQLLDAMLAPCLHDLSKYDLKQVTEGPYRNLNSPNERTINVDLTLAHCIATLHTLSYGHV